MAPVKKVRTLAEREKIILEVEKNPTEKKVSIAKRLGLPVSTLNSILYKKEELREQIAKCGKSSKKRKTSRESTFKELEDILFKWYSQARASRIPINGPILREKALQIAAKLGLTEDEFHASNGWLNRFKERRGLVYKKLSGESATVDQETVDMWMARLPDLIKDYAPRDIYNADETGMFYNVLPDKSLTFKGEACHGGKCAKDRITVLVCANSDGSDKMQLTVIGKSIKPRAFKNNAVIPVKYHANKKAWMTTNVFLVFLHAFDAKMGAQSRKILLFVDNCAAHPPDTSFLKNVKVVYFPPNCTSALQPMDMGVIFCLKRLYHKRLVQQAVLLLDTGKITTWQSMKVNVLQAIHYVVAAWGKVKPSTIENCFKKCGFNPAEEDDDIEEDFIDDDFSRDWAQLECTDMTFENYASFDNDLLTCGIVTVESLCDEARSDDNDGTGDGDEENEQEVGLEPVPTFMEAIGCFEKVKAFMYAQEIGESEMSLLVKLENSLFDIKCKQGKKQTRITDFFKK